MGLGQIIRTILHKLLALELPPKSQQSRRDCALCQGRTDAKVMIKFFLHPGPIYLFIYLFAAER